MHTDQTLWVAPFIGLSSSDECAQLLLLEDSRNESGLPGHAQLLSQKIWEIRLWSLVAFFPSTAMSAEQPLIPAHVQRQASGKGDHLPLL